MIKYCILNRTKSKYDYVFSSDEDSKAEKKHKKKKKHKKLKDNSDSEVEKSAKKLKKSHVSEKLLSSFIGLSF